GATRREILLLHKRLGATMLYVTHDQTEALTLADRIVCMSMGHVQQIGTPLELYDSPNNMFVAGFIGLPPMNFFDVTFEEGALRSKDFTVELSEQEKDILSGYNRKQIVLGVRPEDITEGGSLPVKVFSNENLGLNTLVHGHIGAQQSSRISAKLRGWTDYKNGDTVMVGFKRKHFFDKETTNAIRKGE
ncbi:MAG: sugar ABC transporter ATP-binding protein, partial [Clostridia bacterium]|nr:sugar ABC transporter ATP-binding protein [Clostridia bacterium]